MGDTGSLTLGYVLSFLAIKYSQRNEVVMPYVHGAFSIAFSTLIVPAFDVVRVVLLRLRTKKPLFEPDRNHIHHKFLDMGFSTRGTMVLLLLISSGFSVTNIVLVDYVSSTVLLIGDIAVWVGLNLWWDRVRDKKARKC
jgi:UDP-N-acetylmuramyl pentapeptide phosphotransferase/UDP-N-acetylglucosamine-1-phosphate transferase